MNFGLVQAAFCTIGSWRRLEDITITSGTKEWQIYIFAIFLPLRWGGNWFRHHSYFDRGTYFSGNGPTIFMQTKLCCDTEIIHILSTYTRWHATNDYFKNKIPLISWSTCHCVCLQYNLMNIIPLQCIVWRFIIRKPTYQECFQMFQIEVASPWWDRFSKSRSYLLTAGALIL